MQAKDRELAQAQQQLREKVSTEWCSVCVVTIEVLLTAGGTAEIQ